MRGPELRKGGRPESARASIENARRAARNPGDGLPVAAGLVILERILLQSGAEHLEVAEASVGEGLAQRLVKLVGSLPREDIHATLLLQTSDAGAISP